MIELRFPVIRGPWDGADYLVIADAPDFDRSQGVELTCMQLLAVNKKRQHVQLSIPMAVWRAFESDPRYVTLRQTEIDYRVCVPSRSQIMLAGSDIKEPWRLALTVFDDMVGLFIRDIKSATHYSLYGVKHDGSPIERPVPKQQFAVKNANPTWFVEIAKDRAPVACAPEAPSVKEGL